MMLLDGESFEQHTLPVNKSGKQSTRWLQLGLEVRGGPSANTLLNQTNKCRCQGCTPICMRECVPRGLIIGFIPGLNGEACDGPAHVHPRRWRSSCGRAGR